MDEYSDRIQVCPECGNENVGHNANADWCITDPEPDGIGCGWFKVVHLMTRPPKPE